VSLHVTFECDRCGQVWDEATGVGTISLVVLPPGLVDAEHARRLHLCQGCTAAFEGFLSSGIEIVRTIPH
jgi:hypothetical protein